MISRGGEITTPLRHLPAIGMQQQAQVAALHHPKAEPHEAERPVAQIMGFPGAAGNAGGAEQHLGDFAVACLFQASVESAQ